MPVCSEYYEGRRKDPELSYTYFFTSCLYFRAESINKSNRGPLGLPLSSLQLFSLADTPQPPPSPRIWTHIRGRYWSAKKDDISMLLPAFFFLTAGDERRLVTEQQAITTGHPHYKKPPSRRRRPRSPAMDQISIKTPNPKCRLYWCFNGVYRQEIQSVMLVFSTRPLL
jgi:hypothetical protein